MVRGGPPRTQQKSTTTILLPLLPVCYIIVMHECHTHNGDLLHGYLHAIARLLPVFLGSSPVRLRTNFMDMLTVVPVVKLTCK